MNKEVKLLDELYLTIFPNTGKIMRAIMEFPINSVAIVTIKVTTIIKKNGERVFEDFIISAI